MRRTPKQMLAEWQESRSYIWVVPVFLAILLMVYLYHRYSSSSHPHSGTKPLVTVALAVHHDVPVYLSALGSVTPTYSVTILTQVSGQLTQVLFQEGQLVKAGDLLAEIDPRPYQAQLIQYEGQLARDTALLNNAKIDLKRYKTLWRQDSVSKQTLDTQESLVKQDEGTVKLDQGLVENARINLAYCKITAPIAGRMGLRLIDPAISYKPPIIPVWLSSTH